MKKTIFLLIMFALVMSAPIGLPAQTRGAPNSPDDFNITNSTLGGVKITKYTGTRTDVVIPETIDGLKVTEIGSFSFAVTRGITPTDNPTGIVTINSVVLPSTLVAIGDGAFYWQPLTSISFPSSLRTIGFGAFQQTKFTSIVFSNGIKFVDRNIFLSDFDTITTVVIPPSLANYVHSER